MVAVDDGIQNINTNTCITHVDGVQVGTRQDDSSIGDITWFMTTGKSITLNVMHANGTTTQGAEHI